MAYRKNIRRAFKKLRKMYRLLKKEGAYSVVELLKQERSEFFLKIQKLLGFTSVRSRYGVILVPNWNDRTFEFYVSGGYGRYYAERLTEIDEDFYFIDIGANQGLYSLLAAKNLHCKRVYAFEPVPAIARMLAQNAVLNGVDDKVEIIEKAISSTNGKAIINVKNNHSGLASMEKHLSGDETLEIQCINFRGLDALSWQDDANFLVKVDVEGHEQTVIAEIFNSAFSKNIKEILYECDENWIDPHAMMSLLRENGFNDFERLETKDHYDILARKK